MALKIYNTLTKKVEGFVPLQQGKVSMYVCGPTVYDFLHIGNFRGAIFFNLVRNWLEASGYEVHFVYNYTDIDDKIIKRALEENTTTTELTKKYIEEFEKDFHAFGLKSHTANPRATDHIQGMVEVIESLVESGKAYEVEGEVIYSIDSFKDYGKLSGKNLEELEVGARVDVDNRKKNPLDFVLWKPSKPGEPQWQSPWGPGRPGWHIECTCMIFDQLEDQIDIHGGGIDLIFPHHENEIAQGEGSSGKQYVKYWMHHNFIQFGDEKMSKSLGNVITARQFIETYHPELLKYLFLSVHYRSMLSFTKVQIHQAIAGISRIYHAMKTAKALLDMKKHSGADIPESFQKELDAADEAIKNALDDDFNTPIVFSKIFEIVRLFNATWKLGQKIKPENVATAEVFLDWVNRHGALLALFQEEPETFLGQLDNILLKDKQLERAAIDSLVEQRTEARKNKDFAKSDEIRDQLSKMGILLQDLPGGTVWEVDKGEPA